MDVLIIGGGPSGLLAAKTLAKLGLSVLVLERNDSYDKISRACSMQLVLDDDYEGEGIQIREDSLYFPISNFSVLYHGTLVPIYHKYYHSPKDHKIHFARENGNLPLSYKFDKALLLKELYQAACKLSPLAKELTRAEVLCTSSCSIDAYLPMQTPYHGNVLVIGDAAAYMEVEVQGAFLCGFHAAHAIFYELLGENGFAGYADWWKNSFEFNREDHMQVSQGYALVPTYTDDELDYLFALLEHDCLYGTYSQYKTSKLIWNAIHTHRSKIETEFPGLYAKILRNPDLTLSSTFSRRF